MNESTDGDNPNGPTAKLLKQLEDMGYSQGYLGRKLGIPQSRLSRWRNGRNVGRADDALRLRELASRLRPRKPRTEDEPQRAAA